MKKKKFEKKCREFLEYEEYLLSEANIFIEPMITDLDKLGLKIQAKLLWGYFGKNEGSFDRIPFVDNYLCRLTLTLCKKEDDPNDLDLVPINQLYSITSIRRHILFGYFCFDKYELGDFYEHFSLSYKSVLEIGYEETLKKL